MSKVSSFPSSPQIDILFFGTATRHRLDLIAGLRGPDKVEPLHLFHANAANFGVFGPELDLLLMDAKIILNLLTFDDDSEWKISRLAKLFTNRRFVISERGGMPEEEAYFSSGVVFVARSQIPLACAYFLDRPQERQWIADEGYRLFQMRKESALLQQPLRKTMQR